MKAPTLWIDITELFGQFAVSSHPTGISRVMINLVDALTADAGAFFGEVRPVFWHPVERVPLTFEHAAPGGLVEFFPSLRSRYAASGREMPKIRSGLRKGILTSVPKPFRFRLFPYLHGVTHFLGWAHQVGFGVHPIVFSRSDCLFVPGSFWLDGYAPRLADAQMVPPAAVLPREVAELVRRRYALFVSTLTPRKNHRLLVEAWLRLHDILGTQTPELVFVGGGVPDTTLAEALAQAAARAVPVTRLTGVDDAVLEALYAKTWITLSPSLGEGYGMPRRLPAARSASQAGAADLST